MQGTANDLHNNNVVLQVEDWLLLMGDMQAEGEARLLWENPGLHTKLLKLGHHGSRNASSAAFLAALRPEAALLSCGWGNIHSHPSPLTLARLKSLPGLKLYRTDLQGCILAEKDASGLRLAAWNGSAASWAPPRKIRRNLWKKLQKAGRLAPP
jgi:beta-lactamase superfamily II metal-dependent hydrolase